MLLRFWSIKDCSLLCSLPIDILDTFCVRISSNRCIICLLREMSPVTLCMDCWVELSILLTLSARDWCIALVHHLSKDYSYNLPTLQSTVSNSFLSAFVDILLKFRILKYLNSFWTISLSFLSWESWLLIFVWKVLTRESFISFKSCRSKNKIKKYP